MHPVNSNRFGTKGLMVSYAVNNSQYVGYIYKQISQYKYKVTSDGQNFYVCQFATSVPAIYGSVNNYMTMLANVPNASGVVQKNVAKLYNTTLLTIDGYRYDWNFDRSVNNGVSLTSYNYNLQPPSNLQYTATNSSITFTWGPPATGTMPSEYVVQYTVGTQITLSLLTYSYTVTGLGANTNLNFTVYATLNNAFGGYMNQAGATITGETT